jgi:hypothetical protein
MEETDSTAPRSELSIETRAGSFLSASATERAAPVMTNPTGSITQNFMVTWTGSRAGMLPSNLFHLRLYDDALRTREAVVVSFCALGRQGPATSPAIKIDLVLAHHACEPRRGLSLYTPDTRQTHTVTALWRHFSQLLILQRVTSNPSQQPPSEESVGSGIRNTLLLSSFGSRQDLDSRLKTQDSGLSPPL